VDAGGLDVHEAEDAQVVVDVVGAVQGDDGLDQLPGYQMPGAVSGLLAGGIT